MPWRFEGAQFLLTADVITQEQHMTGTHHCHHAQLPVPIVEGFLIPDIGKRTVGDGRLVKLTQNAVISFLTECGVTLYRSNIALLEGHLIMDRFNGLTASFLTLVSFLDQSLFLLSDISVETESPMLPRYAFKKSTSRELVIGAFAAQHPPAPMPNDSIPPCSALRIFFDSFGLRSSFDFRVFLVLSQAPLNEIHLRTACKVPANRSKL